MFFNYVGLFQRQREKKRLEKQDDKDISKKDSGGTAGVSGNKDKK